ncbi:MAG: glycosyltransferase, partial [Nanoarchaeota archaeon]
MKILFICENYFPFYGGAETLFKNLAEGFSKKEHRVSVLTRLLPDTTKRETIDQVDIHRVPSINSRYIFTFSSLFKAIRLAKKHDIIQTTTFNS